MTCGDQSYKPVCKVCKNDLDTMCFSCRVIANAKADKQITFTQEQIDTALGLEQVTLRLTALDMEILRREAQSEGLILQAYLRRIVLSRTKKGKKGIGAEYWGKRPGNKGGSTPGKGTKKVTHRAERRQGKKETRDE